MAEAARSRRNAIKKPVNSEDMIQQRFIEYSQRFAWDNKVHIWLSGSFLKGSYTKYSDVDLAVKTDDAALVKKYIYGFVCAPVYIGRTERPNGILIVIYGGGLSLDLEIVDRVKCIAEDPDSGYFHLQDIKSCDYIRNERIFEKLVLNDRDSYRISRLFHRSLIKLLSGKVDLACSILNEIEDFFEMEHTEIKDKCIYKHRIIELLKDFKEHYFIEDSYCNELCRLINEL